MEGFGIGKTLWEDANVDDKILKSRVSSQSFKILAQALFMTRLFA
jgi:hypothetical protein